MEKGQMKKGILELCILQVAASEELYGYEIMKRVTAAFPDLNESTVYAVLRRLRADGCTECYEGEVSGGQRGSTTGSPTGAWSGWSVCGRNGGRPSGLWKCWGCKLQKIRVYRLRKNSAEPG